MATHRMNNHAGAARGGEYQRHYDQAVRLERKRALDVLALVNTCPEFRTEIWNMVIDGTTPDIAANKILALKAKGAYR